jgi:hypothetical protein
MINPGLGANFPEPITPKYWQEVTAGLMATLPLSWGFATDQ